jgi:precorrin-6B methylase 2
MFFKLIINYSKQRVLYGKFSGMFLEKGNYGSEYKPKILGTYENELDEFLDSLISPEIVLLDIGSDDGYYSIGLLLRNRNSRAIAVECDPVRCERITFNSKRNNTSTRLNIISEYIVSGEHLLRLIEDVTGPVFIKCDVEGAEYNIFALYTLKELFKKNISMIIETHMSENMEAELINNMRECGYVVNIIDRSNYKKMSLKNVNIFLKYLCMIFGPRWTNESRPKFNRWVAAIASK